MKGRIFYLVLVMNVFLVHLYAQSDFWYQINSPVKDTSILSVETLPNNQIFAGTWWSSFKSTDNGVTWNNFNGPCYGFKSFSTGTIFGLDNLSYTAMWKSTDGGTNWNAIEKRYGGSQGSHDIDFVILSDTVIYRLMNSGDYMYHFYRFSFSYSKDTAKSFIQLYSESSSNGCSCPQALGYRLIRDGGIFLAGTSRGVLRSEDNGVTWKYANTGFPPLPLGSGNPGMSVTKIVVDSFGVVYSLLNYSPGGIYVSRDTGKSWQATGGGLPDGSAISDLKINSYGNLYVSTSNGVYFVRTSNDNWALLNSGLSDITVSSLCIDNSGNLLAGTSHGKLFRSYKSINNVNENSSIRPYLFSLSQNYPNPFNPSTVINYQLPMNSFVTVKVFDVLGREVSTLVNEEKKEGVYSTAFDASKLSSGIYFYKLQTENFSNIKKMILMK